MDAERWKRVSELFEAALELDAADRAAFLDRECGADDELRSQVAAMLEGESADDEIDFLAPNALNVRAQVPRTVGSEMIGKSLGPYTIKRHIGSGGMGNVFLATRKEDFQQRVAIKLLKRGMDSDEILRRFRREIRVLAALGAHPNIARLIDAGTSDDGLPYFVMEYVEGMEIDDYCDAHRLGIEERLKLIESVCSAVHFAHQHTIIHRDLKPSNILVSNNGNPKLIDFGIAKLTTPELGNETAVPTRTEFRAMTPEFASPEQVRGESITTASDVYSLGVVLYKLLTGRAPYLIPSSFQKAVERAVCDTDVARPSTVVKSNLKTVRGGKQVEVSPDVVSKNRDAAPAILRKKLQGDLDNIVMKALRKEPRSRYASAGQLASDVRRYLDGEAVIARPLGRTQLFARLCQRNPVIASLIASLLVGTIFGLGYLSRLSRQLVRSSAIESAAQQAGVLYEGHKYYTEVVGDIKQVSPSAASALKPPATFTIELFDYLNRSGPGTTAQMRSRHPFASRTREPLDEFESDALKYFEAGTGDSFHRFESVRDQPAIRYAIAMKMQQSCCDCHNTHPDSSKTDWQTGQVRGILEVSRPLNNDRERVTSGLLYGLAWIGMITGGLFTAFLVGLSYLKN